MLIIANSTKENMPVLGIGSFYNSNILNIIGFRINLNELAVRVLTVVNELVVVGS